MRERRRRKKRRRKRKMRRRKIAKGIKMIIQSMERRKHVLQILNKNQNQKRKKKYIYERWNLVLRDTDLGKWRGYWPFESLWDAYQEREINMYTVNVLLPLITGTNWKPSESQGNKVADAKKYSYLKNHIEITFLKYVADVRKHDLLGGDKAIGIMIQ